VAAAVILDPRKPINGLADSKVLSEDKRNSLFNIIIADSLSWSIAKASVDEIDRINILQATLLAMRRAVEGLSVMPEQILVDGKYLPDCAMPGEAIVKGDSKVPAISAASILAKVYRDQLMQEYASKYPQFSFHIHKGYGTKQHLIEIEKFGFIDLHRKTFNPIKTMLAQALLK
jgi:ribonuclease HII